MARLVSSKSSVCYTPELEFILSDTRDIFYLTGDTEQPVCYDANDLPCTYGYIYRHRNDYILYISQMICVNGCQKTMAMHRLQDGDQLAVHSGWHMTFRMDL